MIQDQKLLVDAEIKELLKKGDVMEATLVNLSAQSAQYFGNSRKRKHFDQL